eukprot:TRINITY_DN3996_c0_g1_i1.p1 TRINITY_DN3996_c0_g1~~TRINITY_DN3996_c0_g1_i1.p1  ORF type:complete len:298 (+),score=33.59 TRINITY_DN3996_c0_g1_i1:133-1026(+)
MRHWIPLGLSILALALSASLLAPWARWSGDILTRPTFYAVGILDDYTYSADAGISTSFFGKRCVVIKSSRVCAEMCGDEDVFPLRLSETGSNLSDTLDTRRTGRATGHVVGAKSGTVDTGILDRLLARFAVHDQAAETDGEAGDITGRDAAVAAIPPSGNTGSCCDHQRAAYKAIGSFVVIAWVACGTALVFTALALCASQGRPLPGQSSVACCENLTYGLLRLISAASHMVACGALVLAIILFIAAWRNDLPKCNKTSWDSSYDYPGFALAIVAAVVHGVAACAVLCFASHSYGSI